MSLPILLVSTFVMYVLVSHAGDPLGDLRADSGPGRAAKIRERTELLGLDQSLPQRYLTWLSGASRCLLPAGGCDLGRNLRGQDVASLLQLAMGSTLRLVVVATVLALLLGVLVGVLSAVRPGSGFDHIVTFSAFLFFSLPIFWAAVLLKQYLAIGVNDWLLDPRIGVSSAVLLGLLSGLTWGALLGGDTRRRWLVRGVAATFTFGLLLYLSAVEWFRRPALGPALITVLCFAIAVGVGGLMSGTHDRRGFLDRGLRRQGILAAALTMAAAASVGQFALIPLLESRTWATWGTIGLAALLTIAVGTAAGYALGGAERAQAARAAAVTGLLCGSVLVVDILLRAVPAYSQATRGRVVATVGSHTPDFAGPFWQRALDVGFHLVLPTLAILLVSFAQYSRYARATMLEVLHQDHVRTARAKGLPERSVVLRHALRNAMIPLTTLAAIDFGTVIGGAILTENVFGWQGMGQLFVDGLQRADPNPVMAFFVVTALAFVVFNLLADITYAYLDPRIRVAA